MKFTLKTIYRLLFTTLFLSTTVSLSADQKVKTLRADAPEVRYTGRIEKESDGSVKFNWSGTYAEFRFTGSSISMRAKDSKKNYYNLFIDGIQKGVITVSKTDSVIVLAKGLKKGTHSLRLQKRSEGEQGTTTIISWFLDEKGTLLPPDVKRERHIEFIGNSITCGYGTEGLSKKEPFKPETENCNYAYSCIIARYFNADYTLIAHSGRGAARNYGDTARVSKVSMRELMMGTFDEQPQNRWNFSSYRPDLVVINLGSNDFSTKPHPLKEEFLNSYDIIIKQVREVYGDVKILCVAPPKGGAFDYLREYCIGKRDKNLHFTAYLNGVYNDDSDQGSSGHPNYEGQKKIAMTLIPHISTITGWQLTGEPVK